jgi:hypothetical protein
MAFNITGTVSSATRTGFTIDVGGVVFSSSSNFTQEVSFGTDSTVQKNTALTINGTNQIVSYHSSGTTTGYRFSGDVELASKPTWADEWNEPGVFVGNVPLNWTYPLIVTATNGSTGFTAGECFGTVEKTGDEKYWLSFTITGVATAIARNEMHLLVSGVTTTSGGKAISWFTYPFSQTGAALWYGDGGVISIYHPSATIQDYTFSGRVLLAGKPSWAVNTP